MSSSLDEYAFKEDSHVLGIEIVDSANTGMFLKRKKLCRYSFQGKQLQREWFTVSFPFGQCG